MVPAAVCGIDAVNEGVGHIPEPCGIPPQVDIDKIPAGQEVVIIVDIGFGRYTGFFPARGPDKSNSPRALRDRLSGV